MSERLLTSEERTVTMWDEEGWGRIGDELDDARLKAQDAKTARILNAEWRERVRPAIKALTDLHQGVEYHQSTGKCHPTCPIAEALRQLTAQETTSDTAGASSGAPLGQPQGLGAANEDASSRQNEVM